MGSSISVNRDNFTAEVIEKSHEKPVLVDFFAQWCGPCQMLKPMLEKLVQEYDFILAKVDIDENSDLANTYGVQGVPDVKIVVDGEVSDGFVGVLSEPKLRELLAQLDLRSTLDQTLEAIYAAAAIGNVEQAELQLQQLLKQHPEHRGLMLEAANFYIEADRPEVAEALLKQIQEHEKEYFSSAQALRALIQFKQAAKEPGTSDLDLTYQKASQLVVEENYAEALQLFLSLVGRDRRYKNDGARKAMLAIFDLLGNEHPLTKDYRKQLVMALY